MKTTNRLTPEIVAAALESYNADHETQVRLTKLVEGRISAALLIAARLVEIGQRIADDVKGMRDQLEEFPKGYVVMATGPEWERFVRMVSDIERAMMAEMAQTLEALEATTIDEIKLMTEENKTKLDQAVVELVQYMDANRISVKDTQAAVATDPKFRGLINKVKR